MSTHGYGWRPQLPDQRDLLLPSRLTSPTALPESVELRGGMPSVYDQGNIGSCTANAIAAAYEFTQNRQGQLMVTPSRLFIYYGERVLEGTTKQDSGAYIRDGFKVLAKTGACRETTWPYVTSRFAKRPSAKAYAEAKAHQALVYMAVLQTVTALKGCLAEGFPFVFGFTVYESFESDTVASTGIVPMPAPRETVLGGHAVLAVGYDDARQAFLVRNSWGNGWGIGGHFWMPYAYVSSQRLASDFWTLRTSEG